MSDKMIFIAYVLDKSELGTQLLRYAFEHTIIEYYAEPEEQEKLKAYFKANHYTRQKPLIVEGADILDYMPYVEPAKKGNSK